MSILQAPSDVDLAAFCTELYGLENVELLGELSGGMFARPLLIGSSQGRFVLRTHRFRATSAQFRFQAETIDRASRTPGFCPPVLRTLSGEWCVTAPTEGGVIALHGFAEGTIVEWPDWRAQLDRNPRFLVSLGERVAELHNRLAELRPAGDAELDIDLPPIQFHRLAEASAASRRSIDELQVLGPIACERSRTLLIALRGRLDDYWGSLLDSVRAAPGDDVTRQVVHGDISPVNLVWNSQGDAMFIDWDATHLGHRLYDALGDVLHRAPEEPAAANRLCLDHLRDYLAGYRRALQTPLTDRELALVPSYTLARQLEDLRQRVATLPSLPPSRDESYERLILRRISMIDQIIETKPEAFYDCLSPR